MCSVVHKSTSELECTILTTIFLLLQKKHLQMQVMLSMLNEFLKLGNIPFPQNNTLLFEYKFNGYARNLGEDIIIK
jgi:hypothetical protein